MKSKIEWTEQTWNPTTGCTKVSAGCKNCYAETMHKRLNAMGAKGYEKLFNHLQVHFDRFDKPFNRKKPTTYFVNSMSDLFHEDITHHYINRIFDNIRRADWHTYQVLTKRPQEMLDFFDFKLKDLQESLWHCNQPLTNMQEMLSHYNHVWFGVSVENKKEGLPRIDLLRKLPCKIRFLSIEPLLEDLGEIDFSGIHWVIVGGESGSKARRMKKEWVLNIQRQCAAQNVPFFFKQWGAYGEDGIKRSKTANGCLIDGVKFQQKPSEAK